MEWFTADTHFAHKNIAKGSTSWDLSKNPNAVRDFPDQWEMSRHIVDNINQYVGQDDTLFHLGDWSFGGDDMVKKYRDMIYCQNIHLILGNHDKAIRQNRKSLGVPSQSLFSSISERVDVVISGQRFILDHYAARVWYESGRGSIQLHGHSHSTLERLVDPVSNNVNAYYTTVRTMDVGVDNTYRLLGEYRPIRLGEVLEIMDRRKDLKVDHHGV